MVSEEASTTIDLKEEKEFSEETVKASWEAFKAMKQKDGKDREATFMNQAIRLEDNVITVQITNDLFQLIFDDIKSELLIHLRTSLSNNKIKLELESIAPDESKMIYTNREKFEHLADKYPELKQLKERLGLDTDF